MSVKGVTGSHLELLGSTQIDLKIDNFLKTVDVLVVEKMADNVFIIGRDILQKFEGVINYKNLTFSLGDTSIPLMKASPTKTLGKPLIIHCTKTVLVPPYSQKNIRCHLKTKSNTSKRAYLSITGATETSLLKNNLHTSDGIVNTVQGKLDILVTNKSDLPMLVYRNQKVGNFSTFHVAEINTLNHNAEQIHSTSNNENNRSSDPPDRWKNNIDQLYDILGIDNLTHLNATQISELKTLIYKFRMLFAENDDDLGCTDIAEQEIILDTDVPIRDKYYNIPLALRPHAEAEIKRLLDLDILEPSSSNYHSPSFLMRKSTSKDGTPTYRLLTDFRRLNSHVIRSYQPISGIQEMLVLWNKCKYYSKMDFAKGFYQTPLKPESRKYTATSIPGIGFFQYKKSPLGLSGSPTYFQNLVERIFMGLKQSQCVVYLDDVLSAHMTFEGMLENLKAIFERVRISKMLLKPEKCKLFQKRLKFLGVVLDENGISTCPEKVASIVKMAPPKNIRGVRSFLGLSGFYRRWIKDYSKCSELLTRLTRKGAIFKWDDETHHAWESIKNKLVEAPVLAHPDINKKFTLICDASAYCIGGILVQEGDDGLPHPIMYGSAILRDDQRKWSTVQRELYSLVHFCEKYQSFLLNTEFTVITDNTALLHLEKFKEIKSNRLWRWFETLQKFKFNVIYSPSKLNPSDALSRLPKTNDPLISTLPDNAEIDKNVIVENAHVAQIVNSTATHIINNDPKTDSSGPLIFFPNKTMETAQKDDSALQTVRNWIESDNKPKSCSALCPDLYNYYNSYDRLTIINGVICRKWDKLSNEQPANLVCVPSKIQTQILKSAHDIPASGHLGVIKTLKRIRSRFYFPKMETKVKLHIAACHVCLKKRRNHKKLRAPITPFAGTHPGHLIELDLIENLPKSRGYHAILVIVDTFTKWAEAVPLRNTTVEYIANALLNSWVSRQGIPSHLHTDRGGNLETARLIKSLYGLLGITKTASCSMRPQTQGQVEKLNQTIKNMLWKYCQQNPQYWVDCLDQVMFAYRTSVHSSTGFSPFFLDKGRLSRLPMDMIMGTAPSALLGDSYGEDALNLYNRLRETFSFVNQNIKTKQVSSKKRYDEHSAVKKFEVNSWVYVWKPTPADCNYKPFYDHFRGPFKIVQQITPHTYKIIMDEEKGRYDIVHMEHLKDAQIPIGSTPQVIVKHYSDELSPGEGGKEGESSAGPSAAKKHGPGQQLLFQVPHERVRRASGRERTQFYPYQHIV